jgi:hypothetical protein
MTKSIYKVWTFASDSNPNIEYETLEYMDGTTSCNCKGWTRRLAADGSRSCKHTRLVDMGTADNHCKASHNYTTTTTRKDNYTHHAKEPYISHTPKLGYRKCAIPNAG